jgi:hypothetical protein
MNALTKHFHRAQSRLKSNRALRSLAQKAVAPFFTESGPGDSGFYEIPAYLRANLKKSDQQNLRRAADYAERVRVHVQGEVA